MSAAIGTLVFACSKGESDDLLTEVSETPPPEDSSVVVVPGDAQSSSPTTDASTDAKVDADAGKKDAEAGPPPPAPNPGDPCSTPNVVIKKTCGLCGHEDAMCLDTGDGGSGTVSSYAACKDEVVGGCTPGLTEDIDCGNCGKAKKTCTVNCAWSTGVCNQPPNSCVPGTTELSTAGCPVPNTIRRRDCKTDCTWGPFSVTCTTPVNDHVLTAGAAVGSKTSLEISLSPTKTDKMLDWYGGCPNTGSFDVGNFAYEYVEIKNPNTLAATVTVYTSKAPTGASLDTIMAVYEGAVQPMNDAARLACKWGVADQSYSDTALTGASSFAIQKNVVIPPSASVLLYLTTYPEVDPLDPSDSTGPVLVNVLIDALN